MRVPRTRITPSDPVSSGNGSLFRASGILFSVPPARGRRKCYAQSIGPLSIIPVDYSHKRASVRETDLLPSFGSDCGSRRKVLSAFTSGPEGNLQAPEQCL